VRVASKEDRRINLVYLTDIAKPLQQITYELANQTMNEALLDISKEEIEIVKNVFQRVYDNLTNKDLI
jgi:DNA-binding MarR family transcriptional regulator